MKRDFMHGLVFGFEAGQADLSPSIVKEAFSRLENCEIAQFLRFVRRENLVVQSGVAAWIRDNEDPSFSSLPVLVRNEIAACRIAAIKEGGFNENNN